MHYELKQGTFRVLGRLGTGSVTLASPQLYRAMKVCKQTRNEKSGKVGWVLLWLLGVPIPILLILFLLRGCT